MDKECEELKNVWKTCLNDNWGKFIDAKLTEEDACEEQFDLFRGCYLYHMEEYLSEIKSESPNKEQKN